MFRRTLLAALLIATPAAAHIVIVQPKGEAGRYHVASFRVGHGCGEAATTAITVRLPDSVPLARPQPKPGWTISLGREPLAQPIDDHGRRITERIRTITWTGQLPADQFDEFSLQMKLPAEGGDLAFPVTQACGSTVVEWNGAASDRPAPKLTVEAAEARAPAAAPHQH